VIDVDCKSNVVIAVEMMLHGELPKASADDMETIPLNGDHIRFIQNHSPAFVEHLDNGAVVLFPHPYRTLWPLWARLGPARYSPANDVSNYALPKVALMSSTPLDDIVSHG